MPYELDAVETSRAHAAADLAESHVDAWVSAHLGTVSDMEILERTAYFAALMAGFAGLMRAALGPDQARQILDAMQLINTRRTAALKGH